MGVFNFILKVADDVKRGKVVKSKFATVGKYKTAVDDGLGKFAVFNDVTGELLRFNGPYSAVQSWHKINVGCFNRSLA